MVTSETSCGQVTKVFFQTMSKTANQCATANSIVFVLDPFHEDVLSFLRSQESIDTMNRDNPESNKWRAEATALMICFGTQITEEDLSHS